MLSLRIALRYLLSRKSHGAVNVISAISLAAIAVAAAAMVIVLSVFNGFTQLAEQKMLSIAPTFMVTPAQGKSLNDVDTLVARLQTVEGIATVSPEISERAFVVNQGLQMAVTLRGMTPQALQASHLADIVVDGSNLFATDSTALLSVGVALNLALRPTDNLDSFTVYEPRRLGRINPANPMAGFRQKNMQVGGVFQSEQDDYDRDLLIVPFHVAAMLLNYSNQASNISLWIDSKANAADVEARLRRLCDDNPEPLVVKNRRQQQEQAFRMIAIEKWITFVMLAFILLVASCNIISTLSMLILEKQENMSILRALGSTRRAINAIFQTQGWLIVLLGGVVGMLLGALLVLGQQCFGWIKIGTADPSLMSITSYPVAFYPTDLVATALTLLVVALVITPVIPLISKK